MGAMGLVGVLFGLLVAQSSIIETIVPPKDQFNIWTALGIVLVIFLAIAVHELGHLLTGLAQGNKFQLFIVGPLGIKRVKEQVKVYFNKELGMYGGVAASSPTRFGEDTANKLAQVLLAGPLSSLIFAIFCFTIGTFLPQPIKFLVYVMGLISFMLFLATSLPSRSGIFYSDRKRYQRLKGQGIGKEVELAIIQANTLKVMDKSIRAMPEETLNKILQDDSPMFKYLGYYYLYEYHLGNEEKLFEIREEMDKLSSELPKVLVLQLEQEINNMHSA